MSVQMIQGLGSGASSSRGEIARPRSRANANAPWSEAAGSNRRSPSEGGAALYRDRDAMEAAIDRSSGRFLDPKPGVPPQKELSNEPLSEEEEYLAAKNAKQRLVRSYAQNVKRLDSLMSDM